MNWKIVVALLMSVLVAVGSAPYGLSVSQASQSCFTSPAFKVLNASWGTPGNAAEAGPGQQNVPLTLNVQYYPNDCSVTSLTATLGALPSGMTDTNGNYNAYAYTSSILSGQIFQVTFYLDIASSASLGNHNFPVAFTWNNTSYNNLSQASSFALPLSGTVDLVFSSPLATLAPGQESNVSVIASNQGSGAASQIKVTPASSALVSILNVVPTLPSIRAGGSASFNLLVFVSPSAANSPVLIVLSSSYEDAYGNLRSISQTLGFAAGAPTQLGFSLSSPEQSLVSNGENNVPLMLSNLGKQAMNNVSLTVSPSPGLSLIGSDGYYALGSLAGGGNLSVNLKLLVASSAPSPSSLLITVGFTDPSNSLRSQSRALSFQVIPNAQNPVIVALASGSHLLATGSSNVSLQLLNNSTQSLQSLSLSFSFSPASQLVWTGLNPIQVASLGAGQATTVAGEVYVPSIAASAASLQVLITFTDASGTVRTETSNLGLIVEQAANSNPIIVSLSSGNILTPGEVNNVSVQLSNPTSQLFQNLSVTTAFAASTQAAWIGSNSMQISSLAAGATSSIPGQVYVPSSGGSSATLTVSLGYYDAGGTFHQQTSNLGLIVRGLINIQVTSVAVTPQQLVAGQIFSITLTITNTGTSTATNLVAAPQLPAQFSSFGTPQVFVGDLLPSTPTPLTLTFTTKNSTAAGDYTIPIQFTFLDSLRSNLTQSTSVPVAVSAANNNNNSSTPGGTVGTGRGGGFLALLFLPTILIVAVILFVVGFYVGKKRRRGGQKS